MMKCPNCEQTLIAVEKGGLELDFCPNCKGLWFDAWEWDDLAKILNINENEFNKLITNGEISSVIKEKVKQCPVCNRKMEKTEINGITLDRCLADGGVWFDEGELLKILNIIIDKSDVNKEPIEKYLIELYTKRVRREV